MEFHRVYSILLSNFGRVPSHACALGLLAIFLIGLAAVRDPALSRQGEKTARRSSARIS